MEKDELREHIKQKFEEIAELEKEKALLNVDLKKELIDVFKAYMPDIVKRTNEISYRVFEIKQAAKELQEIYYCEAGRVIYLSPWLNKDEQITIEGFYKEENPAVLEFFENNTNDPIEGPIESEIKAFILKCAYSGGDKN